MNQPWILLLPILFPLLAGLLLLLCPLNHRGAVGFYSLFALAASGAAAVYCALQVRGQLVLLRLNPELRLLLRPDNVGRLLLLGTAPAPSPVSSSSHQGSIPERGVTQLPCLAS